MTELPTGTVTFLFTDIEGSTKLLHELGGPRYAEVLAEHQRILREAFAAHHGREVDTQGDSFFVAFRRAKDAVSAAVDAQRDLAAGNWPAGAEVKVRMGLHTGEPQVGEERYVGLGVHKAARIGAAGHGGQVLLSRTTRELVEDEVPPGVAIRDLGERRLKDLERPERLSQLIIDGLPSEFGPLHTLDVELRRKRRRMYVGSALIGVLAAAVAIPVFAFGQGNGGGSADVAPNSVAIIDPASNRVVDSVSNVGGRPSAIAFGEGAVWVANYDERTLARIDPTTRAVTDRVRARGHADRSRRRYRLGLGRARNPRVRIARRPGRRGARDDRRCSSSCERRLDRGRRGSSLVRVRRRRRRTHRPVDEHRRLSDRSRGLAALGNRHGLRLHLGRERRRQQRGEDEPADERRRR